MPGIDFISLLPNLMLPVCVSEVRLSLILFFIFAEDSFLPGLPPDFDWDDLGLVFGLFPGLTDDLRDETFFPDDAFPDVEDVDFVFLLASPFFPEAVDDDFREEDAPVTDLPRGEGDSLTDFDLGDGADLRPPLATSSFFSDF